MKVAYRVSNRKKALKQIHNHKLVTLKSIELASKGFDNKKMKEVITLDKVTSPMFQLNPKSPMGCFFTKP
jgi:uncharacterized protein (UPF0335 family)